MDIDLELQEKEVFREIVWEGNFDRIAIWLDGEWSVFASVHYEQKKKDEEPVYVLQQQRVMDAYSSDETLDFLIQEIEDMLNARMRNDKCEQA
ncbi:fatty acid-binding protein DegV [Bacillus fengqiuensis]|nr:fatty acid-binding protein DegV [Bacillus fengqiuensis]